MVYKLVIARCSACGKKQRHVTTLAETPLCLFCKLPLDHERRVTPLQRGLTILAAERAPS